MLGIYVRVENVGLLVAVLRLFEGRPFCRANLIDQCSETNRFRAFCSHYACDRSIADIKCRGALFDVRNSHTEDIKVDDSPSKPNLISRVRRTGIEATLHVELFYRLNSVVRLGSERFCSC